MAKRFPDGQLYVNLRGFDPSGSATGPDDALRYFLDALAVPPQRMPADLESRAGLFRSMLDGKRVLIVLDNARDSDQVRPLLPGSPGSLVVVTSRSELTGLVAAEGATPLGLDVLTEDEAHELLGRRLGPEVIAAEPEPAAELIALCAWLPLALGVAAGRAATRPGLSLAALAAELRDTRNRLEALDAGDAATDVRAVLSWSYEQLSEPAARMFRLLGLHPGPDVSVAAAASLAGVPHGGGGGGAARADPDAYGGRASAGPVRVPRPAPRLRLPSGGDRGQRGGPGRRRPPLPGPLPAYRARRRGAVQPRPQAARPGGAGAGRGAGGVFRPGTGPGLVRRRRPGHAGAVHPGHLPVATTSTVWQIAWTLSPFLYRRDRWHEGIGIQRQSLRAAQRLGDPAGLGHAHYELGRMLVHLGDFGEAQPHLAEALDVFGRLGDRASEATVHQGFGALFEQQGRYAQALVHAREALRIVEEIGPVTAAGQHRERCRLAVRPPRPERRRR